MHQFDEVINRRHTGSLKWDFMPVSQHQRTGQLLPMWVSDYDFAVPPAVVAALHQRVEHGVFGYSTRGEDYFTALCNWFLQRHQLAFDRQWVCSVEGVAPGLSLLLQMLTRPGEGVVVQAPYYGTFGKIITLNQRRLLENPLRPDSKAGYCMDLDHLTRLLETQRPPLMILCNPHNPCGRCWSVAELEALLTLCQRYQVCLLSDEIWCDLLLPAARFTSVLQIENQPDTLIVANSASKTFGLSALRIANFIIPDNRVRQNFIERLNAHGMDVFNVLAMTAATAAYHHGQRWLDQLLAYLADNRNWFCQQAERYLPWAQITPAQASYLLWMDCRELGVNDEELKRIMIEHAGILPSMGCDFGDQGSGFIRLNLGCPRQYLHQAMDGLKQLNGL